MRRLSLACVVAVTVTVIFLSTGMAGASGGPVFAGIDSAADLDPCVCSEAGVIYAVTIPLS